MSPDAGTRDRSFGLPAAGKLHGNFSPVDTGHIPQIRAGVGTGIRVDQIRLMRVVADDEVEAKEPAPVRFCREVLCQLFDSVMANRFPMCRGAPVIRNLRPTRLNRTAKLRQGTGRF